MTTKIPKIAVIGGGTGSFTLLRKLKLFTPNIVAIVNMSDSGGSTGVLRDELGVLPPGDIRQCLVALSNLPEVRELFDYRFGEGMLSGHSLGNVILSGLELRYEGDYEKAIEVAGRMLDITGHVDPVTLQNHQLVMKDGGETITGEHLIGHRKINGHDVHISHEPNACINPSSHSAIIEADLVVIAPGNLYGSLLPALAVEGMEEAFTQTNARKVMVANLVNKPGQTDNWHVVDYVKEIEKYVGKDQIDCVLYNNQPPSSELLEMYAQDSEFPIDIGAERFHEIATKAKGASLVAKEVASQDNNDKLWKRTLIRHDANEVWEQILELFN